MCVSVGGRPVLSVLDFFFYWLQSISRKEAIVYEFLMFMIKKNPTSNQRIVRFHCQLFVLLIVEIDDLHGDGDDDGDGLSRTHSFSPYSFHYQKFGFRLHWIGIQTYVTDAFWIHNLAHAVQAALVGTRDVMRKKVIRNPQSSRLLFLGESHFLSHPRMLSN